MLKCDTNLQCFGHYGHTGRFEIVHLRFDAGARERKAEVIDCQSRELSHSAMVVALASSKLKISTKSTCLLKCYSSDGANTQLETVLVVTPLGRQWPINQSIAPEQDQGDISIGSNARRSSCLAGSLLSSVWALTELLLHTDRAQLKESNGMVRLIT